MSREGCLHFAIAGLCLVAAVPAGAQTSNATLQGTVTDAQGGVLPGVNISLTSPATGLQRSLVTNSAGVYFFNFLPAGTCVLTAELSGFKTLRREDTRLEIGQNLQVNLTLEVGRMEEVVTVESSAPPLDRTSPSIGTVIQADQLKGLPLAGRHWRASCCWHPAPSTPATART